MKFMMKFMIFFRAGIFIFIFYDVFFFDVFFFKCFFLDVLFFNDFSCHEKQQK